MMTESIT